MSVYGIDTEEECRKAIDELLAMVDRAEEALKIGSKKQKHDVAALNSCLKGLFNSNRHTYGPGMSEVEVAYFWPAVQDAYIRLRESAIVL